MQRQRSLVYSILSDPDIFFQSVTQDRDHFFRSRNTFLLSAGETLLENSGDTFSVVRFRAVKQMIFQADLLRSSILFCKSSKRIFFKKGVSGLTEYALKCDRELVLFPEFQK